MDGACCRIIGLENCLSIGQVGAVKTGAVNGGDIYGDIPSPQLGHSQDAGNGRLIPTSSVEQFAAPLGRWFGLNDTELNMALPGLVNFPSGAMAFI